MFYIEKNDKPNWLIKKTNIIKVEDNTIILPIYEKIKPKGIEKLAKKTNKIIRKNSNSVKSVVSKEIQKEKQYINLLNTYGIEIADGKWLFEILIPDVVQKIVEQQKIEKVNISILINDLTEIELENIKELANKYQNINIVTNHIEKFTRLQKAMLENGIIITITNNKKKSLMKSQIIINVDFPKELIDRYRINEYATIINIKEKLKIKQKRFEGRIINDYEIKLKNNYFGEKIVDRQYYCKDLYESELHKKTQYKELRKKIKKEIADIIIIPT